jgi:hypothetical protein
MMHDALGGLVAGYTGAHEPLANSASVPGAGEARHAAARMGKGVEGWVAALLGVRRTETNERTKSGAGLIAWKAPLH